MLKEYRICMPMSVDEYQIGQLYMIARHSAEQSEDGEGVEVVENRPHEHPVHGKGQYTEKRIYLSSKLPVWIRGYVPKFFYITEKAWNYYPYTETEYTCSFVPKLNIKILTRYENNNGSSENCLNLPEEVITEREVDHVDIVCEPVEEKHYKVQEDLSLFQSKKTKRGPLSEGWRNATKPIMCSYKLVNISFQVFGLQTKVEDLIQRTIRNVLLLGHRQAFAWIDEWHGMTIEDVRDYERGMHLETNQRVCSTHQSVSENQVPSIENMGPGEGSDVDTKEADTDSLKSTNSKSTTPTEESVASPTTPKEKAGYFTSWFKW
ncbi:cytoplasmic phosphatidylinositol transfer protein 1-like [Oratosquilla oratoria]|uniref:cytoplasmic phosphatidylinositol transfer protein 1-like n=1 Tax=Oratosquilla oratoria TaxID=337810 RepID=UPI003F774D19